MADQQDENETPKTLLLVPEPEDEKDSLLVPEAEVPSPLNPGDHEPAKNSGDKPQVSDLPEDYRKALHQLKRLVREHDFGTSPATPEAKEEGEKIKKIENALPEDDGAKTLEAIEETIVPKAAPEAGLFIWSRAGGVNLMEDDLCGRTDVVLHGGGGFELETRRRGGGGWEAATGWLVDDCG